MSYLSDNLTEEESAFLKRNTLRMPYPKLTADFRKEYPRHARVTEAMIRKHCSRMSWPHLRSTNAPHTEEELEFIADRARRGDAR
jgi:hypothetical protein